MNREGFVDDVENILTKTVCQEFNWYITSKSVCDIFYIYRKETKNPSIACKKI